MFSTTVQQGAQAQLPVPPSEGFACVPQRKGEIIFAFKDIKFTPEQAARYDEIEAKLSARAVELGKEVRTEEIPGGTPDVVFKEGAPAAIKKEIGDAHTEMIRKNASPDEMVKLLTQKYGRYAEFSKPRVPVFTPEQRARSLQITRDAETEIMAMLRPEQQKVFQANLIRVRQYDACVATRPTQAGTIVDIASSNSQFSTLVTALKAAGLVETLSGKGPFTVFAPTNKAFAALPKGTLEKLLKPENREVLRKVLTYHVVSGDLMAKDLRSGRVATVEDSPVAVQVQRGRVRVNNSNVIKADVDAKNGVIHVIDKVLLPPGL
ncbi:fasciclin domain-containing protein [Phormidesmis sp. 146-33]